jgi:hypothetical protein
MRARKHLIVGALAVAAAAGLATVVAQADEARGGWHSRGMMGGMMGGMGPGMMGEGMMGPGMMGGGPMMLFEMFDTNKDGQITQEEINAVRDERFAKFDTDHDGKLSLQEYEALWLDAMRPRMVRQFQANDADGDAAITPEEFRARYSRIVVMLDANGDGIVTREEVMQLRRGDRDDDGRRGPRGEGRGPDRN